MGSDIPYLKILTSKSAPWKNPLVSNFMKTHWYIKFSTILSCYIGSSIWNFDCKFVLTALKNLLVPSFMEIYYNLKYFEISGNHIGSTIFNFRNSVSKKPHSTNYFGNSPIYIEFLKFLIAILDRLFWISGIRPQIRIRRLKKTT